MAIANLEQLRQQPSATVPSPEELVGTRLSVKTRMLVLMAEADRDWSVAEVLEEYDRRGFPIQAKDPKNALRAAVAEANRDGLIFRTSTGRYKSGKWHASRSHHRRTRQTKCPSKRIWGSPGGQVCGRTSWDSPVSAPVAQWTERPRAKGNVAGPNPAGGTWLMLSASTVLVVL